MFKLKTGQKQFLIIISLWFLTFFLIYFRILPRLHKERYWLMIAPLPFIFLAFWFYILDRLGSGEFKFWNRYITNGIIIAVSGVLLFSNLTAIKTFYKSLENGNLVVGKYHKKITVGPYRFFTGYGEMKDITDYMVAKMKSNSSPALCFKSLEYQNKLGFEFLLDKYYQEIQYIQTGDGGSYNCIFYVITKTSRGKKELKEFEEKYDIEGEKVFKSLSVWELELKDETVEKKRQVKGKSHRIDNDGRTIYWKDVFINYKLSISHK